MEGFPSGQRGQTVNLLVDAFEGSNPSPSTIITVNRDQLTVINGKPKAELLITDNWKLATEYRGVEQLVARRAHNPEAEGSSPSPATNFTITF